MTQTVSDKARRADASHVEVQKRSLVLNRRASLWVSFGVSAHTLWTSAAPALVYRLYAEEWHLSHTVTTGIFAIYPVFVVVTLVVFGDVSDHIGRRATMLGGLVMSLFGVLILAVAPNVAWLYAARAIMGVGVGLASGSSTAAILDYSADGYPERAASAATIAQAIGFVIALLLGGTLIQYAPWPTRLSFWVLAGVIAALTVVAWFLPGSVSQSGPGRWTPRVPAVPKGMRVVLTIASIAFVTAFAEGAVLLSLGGQVAHDLVGLPNALVNGSILSGFAITWGAGSILGRRLSPRAAILFGALASGAGMLMLIEAVVQHELAAFLFASVLSGAGYSLLFLGGLVPVNAAAPTSHRGGALSALYLVGYLSMGSATLAVAFLASVLGFERAVEIGAGVIALLSLAVFALAAANGSALSNPSHTKEHEHVKP